MALLANGGEGENPPPAVWLEFFVMSGTEEVSVRRGRAQLCPAWCVLQAWDWGTFSQGCIVQAGPPAPGWSQIGKWAVGRAPTSMPLPRWPENADFTPHGKTLAWAELPRAVENVAPLT